MRLLLGLHVLALTPVDIEETWRQVAKWIPDCKVILR